LRHSQLFYRLEGKIIVAVTLYMQIRILTNNLDYMLDLFLDAQKYTLIYIEYLEYKAAFREI
jgi:hypothetical protein